MRRHHDLVRQIGVRKRITVRPVSLSGSHFNAVMDLADRQVGQVRLIVFAYRVNK